MSALGPSGGTEAAGSDIRRGVETSAVCQACGACCSYAAEWPRFSLEDDAALALIPAAYTDEGASGMRCDGDRCSALVGTIGSATACAVYAVRPDVCRDCEPGDDACTMARDRFGLAALV